MQQWLTKLGLVKQNYRGKEIPVIGGLIITGFLALSWLIFLFFEWGKDYILIKLIYLVIIISSIGLVDDAAGGNIRGFKGHFSQLFAGRLTTGFLKAIITLIASLLVIEWKGNWFIYILDLGLLVFFTNFLNLLDLRPGRSIKFFFLFSLSLIIFSPFFILYLIPVFIISAFYLIPELREEVMLGDSGSNILGVLLGFGYTYVDYVPLKILLLLFIIILTVLSEKYSFSKIIETNYYLKWFDLLGRRFK